MRSPLWLATLFATASFLAACGGGGVGESDAGQDKVSCALNLSTYADGNVAGSGYAIAQNGNLTQAVPRRLDGCAIRSLASARVSLCIRHAAPNELHAQLILPVTGPLWTQLTPHLLASAQDKRFCDFNNGSVYAMDIPIEALAALPSVNDRWNAAVIDTLQNNQSGSFISWSLLLTGNR